MKTGKNVERETFTRRDFLKISGLSAGGLALGSFTHLPMGLAKNVFPAGKITFIVPDKAGGGYDTISRIVCLYTSKYLKEASPGGKSGDIIVKNEGAASGRKGIFMIYRGKPNGYTIGIMSAAVITDEINEKSDIDYKRFTILYVINATGRLIIAPQKGFKSWNEVVDAMKKKELITMACGSAGRTNHFAAIVMNEKVGTNFKLVNFPGTAETINALLRGDVDLVMAAEDTAQALGLSKQVNVLVVTDPDSEMSQYPGAVSLTQLGFAEEGRVMNLDRFVVAPPVLEAESRNVLLSAIKKASTDKDFVAWAKKSGVKLKNIYGDEAQKYFVDQIKNLEDHIPMVRKYLG